MEETLVLIKPEGVEKKIIGEVISRFERVGLQLMGMKMTWPTEDLVEEHYALTPEWVSGIGKKTRDAFAKTHAEQGSAGPSRTSSAREGIKMKETNLEIAKRVQSWLKNHLKSGAVIAMVWRGNKAVEVVRKLVGATEPKSAAPGTIRGDYSSESYDQADKEKRSIRNIIHASGTVEEAKKEIGIWFESKTLYL